MGGGGTATELFWQWQDCMASLWIEIMHSFPVFQSNRQGLWYSEGLGEKLRIILYKKECGNNKQ